MKITYYGHSSFFIETAGKSILFDPFISPNELAKEINVAEIQPDYMLISHGHNDHIADAVPIALQSGCVVSAVYEITSWMEKHGVKNTHGMNIGGSWKFDFGTVKLVQAVHSSTLPDGSTGGVPCGFVVENAETCFYYSGDTALYSDMSLISKRFRLKTAFLPIGDNFTMGIQDAVEAAKILRVSHVVGMHFDTFGFIKIDHKMATDSFAEAGIKLELMSIGSSINI
jgi:L-ascorbate metabolism protein UlaG (beta-lactamase superfamily)